MTRRSSSRHGATVFGSGGTSAAGALANLFGAAVAQHQAGALAEAERQYRYILTLFPTHADSLQNLGLIALHGGNAASAVELIGKAIRINGKIAEYHYNIALAFRALNRMTEVAAHLERAIELRNDYAAAHLNLGNVRREQNRLAEAIACYERALALTPASAATHFNLGNMLAQQGRWDRAIDSFERAVALAPGHAEAHSGLGTALAAQGKIDSAIAHFEQAVALRPDLAGAHEDLGKALMLQGRPDRAILAVARALEISETESNKTSFAQCAKLVAFSADDSRYRRLLLRALVESWERPRALCNVCISLIKLGGVVRDCIARANSSRPTRFPAAERSELSALNALAEDELLCRLLEIEPIRDVDLERLLANVRYTMLMSVAEDTYRQSELNFYCSLARQCFINEYVFSVTDGEAEQARQLWVSLANVLAAGEAYPALWPVAVGAYFPLHSLPNAEILLDRPWPQSVQALIVQQVKEPARERELAADIPALTGIGSMVSELVRQQYEESPYPRWVKAGPPQQPGILKEYAPAEVRNILIAGCGTGLAAIELARKARGAHILAVDLSLASLSYAKRMAQELGVTNLEFAQADIMRLGSIGRTFDFIDASGVLHHLADLWEGWRVLLPLLRPGGAMQVGLYSELARRNVVAARMLIAERGYRPVPDDIRRCREEIIASGDPLLSSLVQWGDFFSTSEVRDLLFHVEEHRVTIPEIKSFLQTNSLKFVGFVLPWATQRKFAARFPDHSCSTNLDCWQAFESDFPETFAGMYLFEVQKLAAHAH